MDANDTAMVKAIDSAIRNAKRALLDLVDLQKDLRKKVPLEEREAADEMFWEKFKKRIHNEVSVIDYNVKAAYEIVRMGGVIPPFGRSDQQIDDAEDRKALRIASGLPASSGNVALGTPHVRVP